jgi:hypothetical protein
MVTNLPFFQGERFVLYKAVIGLRYLRLAAASPVRRLVAARYGLFARTVAVGAARKGGP